MKKYFTLLLVCFFSKSLLSQSPGGVGTGNLRGWFDSEVGVTLTSGFVSAWTDRSGIGNASQANATERPSVSSNIFNYHSATTYDGINDNLDLVDRMASGTTGVSAYAVAMQTGSANDTWGSIFNGQVNGPSWTGGGYGLVALNAGNTLQGFYVRDYNTRGVSSTITNNVPFLTSGVWNGTTANNVQAFRNGTSIGTLAYTPGSVGDGGSTWIGSGDGANNNWSFQGHIAEIAVFNTGLSTANNNRVMSYFALKYGITMGINYTNSAGTTIYSTTGAYTNNIVGITRDDGSGLIQRQSQIRSDSMRVYISTLAASNSANAGTFASDLSHVVVGADNGRMCWSPTTSVDIPAGFGITSRIAREWKVTNTNFGGTFSMDFRLNACAIPTSVNVSDLRLLIDDDGNYTAGTNTSVASGAGGITISYSNPLITVSGISTSLIASGATRFITLGSVSPATPLPIELSSFEGICKEDGSVKLDWQTASEINNDYFAIEKTVDGEKFELVGKLKGSGNSHSEKNYSYTDNLTDKPTMYYRLKQTDFDGSFKYSPIITVNCNSDLQQIFVIPNPAKNEITVSNLKSGSEIIILNALGEVMMEFKNTIDPVMKMDVSHLKEGVYYVRSTFSHVSENVKFMIVR